jgi:hypothetical protein
VLSVCSVPIDAFPAKAGPTKSIRCTRRTGFSQEGDSYLTIGKLVVDLISDSATVEFTS